MSNQKIDARDYEAAPERHEPDSSKSQFVLVDDTAPAPPAPLIDEAEKELRCLKSRFKKLFGYKPTGVTTEELLNVVETTEHERGLKRDGIL